MLRRIPVGLKLHRGGSNAARDQRGRRERRVQLQRNSMLKSGYAALLDKRRGSLPRCVSGLASRSFSAGNRRHGNVNKPQAIIRAQISVVACHLPDCRCSATVPPPDSRRRRGADGRLLGLGFEDQFVHGPPSSFDFHPKSGLTNLFSENPDTKIRELRKRCLGNTGSQASCVILLRRSRRG